METNQSFQNLDSKSEELLQRVSVPSPFDSHCFVGNNVFTKEDCDTWIQRIQNPRLIDTRTTHQNTEGVVRIVERTSLKDAELAKWLFKKVAPLCPKVWKVEEEDEKLGPFSKGEWELDELEASIQIYRYTPGGTFTKHTDGPVYHSIDKRSLFTALVYLNSEFKGGHTTVFTDDESTSFKVPYSTGACFVMLQRTLHEGSKVEEGVKYALRCDVLYRRISGTPQEVLQGLSQQEQAKKWFQLASHIEGSGHANESVQYYQRAYKLDPDLPIN